MSFSKTSRLALAGLLLAALASSCQVGAPVAANGSGAVPGPVIVVPTMVPTSQPTAAPTPPPGGGDDTPPVTPSLAPTSAPTAVPSASPSATASPVTGNLVAAAMARGNFTTLLAQLSRPEFAEILARFNNPSDQYTVFAPNDAAFAKLSNNDREALFADTERMRQLLLYHVVTGLLPASELVKLEHTETLLNNNVIQVNVGADGHIMVNDSQVVSADFMASNGIIHEIDTLLTVPNPSTNPVPTPTPEASPSPSPSP